MSGAIPARAGVSFRLRAISLTSTGESRNSSESAGAYKSVLVNSGAEAVENAVKVARAATGRQAVIVFDRAFHGRTLLTMTMTSKVAYKRGFGPFAPEVYRAPVSIEGV